MLIKRNTEKLFSAELTHNRSSCPFLQDGLCFAQEEIPEGESCHGEPCTVHLTIRKDRLSDRAKWLCNIFADTSESDFIAVLSLDGCNVATAKEARELCSLGKFEEAADLAHMGGWL